MMTAELSSANGQVNEGAYRNLLAAGLLIACLAVLIGFASLAVSADTLPSDITSDWYVSSDEYYNSSSTNLSAYIYVESGGNLTLDNVTIDVTGGSGIFVNNGGRLFINNSVIQQNGGSWGIELYYGGALVVMDSDLLYYDYFSLYETNAIIDGNELTPSNSWIFGIGLYYGWNSYSADGPYILNNSFGDSYTSVWLDGYYTQIGEMVIKNNTFTYTNYYGMYYYLDSATTTRIEISENSFGDVYYQGIYLNLQYGTFPELYILNNNFSYTSSEGIYISCSWSDYSNSEWSISGNYLSVNQYSTAIYIDGYYTTFNNLSINNNTIPQAYHGLYFYVYDGAYNVFQFSGNDIQNLYTDAALYMYAYYANGQKMIFHGNHIANSVNWWWNPVFYIEHAYGTLYDFEASDNVIEHTYTQVFQGYWYGINGPVNLTFTNNTVNDTRRFWYSYGFNIGDLTITNNTFTNIQDQVFYMEVYYQTVRTITINDNYADNCYYSFMYMYGGQATVSGDVNVHHNTIKNQMSDYAFYFGFWNWWWGGNSGMSGWFNFTDNKIGPGQPGNWAYGLYTVTNNGNMEGLNIQRNVFRDLRGWSIAQIEFQSTQFAYDATITNNTIVRCNEGLRYYGGSGGARSLFVQNNTAINNDNSAIYLDLYNYNIQNTMSVEGNLFIDNYYGMIIYAYETNFPAQMIANNTFLKNQYGLEIEYPTSLRIENNKITSNSQYGLYLYGDSNQWSELWSYNNIIQYNGRDIYMEYGIKMYSHNDTFETTTLASWGGNAPELWVMGILDVQVLWEDGSGPVADAELEIYDKDGNLILEDRVDTNGWYKNIDLLLYKILQTGKQTNIPVTINASKYGILASVKVTPVYHTVQKVYLDNVPPVVTLYSPEDMFQTNKDTVRVAGVTEVGAYLVINTVPIDLTATGGFEYYAPLTHEGNNDIRITAKDRFNNTRLIILHIFKDTVAPVLSIDEPTDGSMTNDPSIMVIGETEPGAILKVNENIVPLDANGRFEYTVLLSEGENKVHVVVSDPAGNEVSKTLTIWLDSVPPGINIISPTNGLITNAAEIDVRGMANGGTSIKLNGINLKLLGETFVTTHTLTSGINTLLFEAWDDAGNYASIQFTIIQDANPPQLDVVSPKDNLFTSNSVLVVTGSSDMGNAVTVNGVSVTLDPNNGQFSYTLLLKEGTNRISVKAVDKIGNTYEVVRNVFLDTVPPALTITNPIHKSVVSDPKLLVEGLTDLNAVVTINGLTVPTESGSFKKPISLKEGVNRIVVIATDLAGNRATEILEVYLDTTAGIQIYSPGDGLRTTADNITISGKLEAGASLKVNGLDIQLDDDGAFSHEFPLLMGSNEFSFVVTDLNGNVDSITRSVVREQIPPTPKKTESGLSSSASWLAAALVGAIVGALMAIILFLLFSRKYGGRKTQDEDIATEDLAKPKEPEEPEAPKTKPEPPTPKPDTKKPKEIRMVPPPPSMKETVKKEEPKPEPPAPFTAVDAPKSMSDKAAGGELGASSGEVSDLQRKIEALEAKGEDTTKIKQSLRMAEIYQAKNNPDKAEKHIQRAKQMLTEMDSSGEIAPKGGEVEIGSRPEKSPATRPATTPSESKGVPTIPPAPWEQDAGSPRKSKKDGGA